MFKERYRAYTKYKWCNLVASTSRDEFEGVESAPFIEMGVTRYIVVSTRRAAVNKLVWAGRNMAEITERVILFFGTNTASSVIKATL